MLDVTEVLLQFVLQSNTTQTSLFLSYVNIRVHTRKLSMQHQKRFSVEESILSAKAPHGGGFSNKNLSNIGGQQAEVNTNEMVICVKSLLAEHNIAQKVSCFKYRIR